MLCKPCYKIIKRHASGIDTGYCAASHWSDGQSHRGPCKTCTDVWTRD